MSQPLNSLWEPPFPFPSGAADLPPRGILVATPALLNAVRDRAPEVLRKAATIFMLGGTSIIKGQDFFVAGPVLGAPMAVMALEVLVGGGAQKILFAGFGGSLSPELEPGDFLAPGSAIAGEGTSAHYEGGRLAPDPELLKSVEKALLRRELLRGGPIWSTDGPLRETAERRAAYRALGAVAVDMEVSALFAAASFREVALAALILLTDSFGQGPWREGFKLPKFKKNLSLCGEIAWEALQG